MSELKNDTFLKALRRVPVDYTPVWIMRQAGRYLPEYRAIREKMGGFLAMCKTPAVACEITLQPLNRFDLDAAIIFSDILTIPDAMGLGLYFEQGEGPCFKRPVRTEKDVLALKIPSEDSLAYVYEAVKLTRAALGGKVPLIGFAGSPWTMATYMVEGGSTKDFATIKRMMYEAPALLHQVLHVLSEAVSDYLIRQVKAGAQVLKIFDSWGGVLNTSAYHRFSLDYMKKIVQRVKAEWPQVPIILFTKNGHQWLESIADSGCDGVGIDWTIDIGTARRRVGEKVALQGNMDPMFLYAQPEEIRAEVKSILSSFGEHPGHVFNLGHGIHHGVSPDHVKVLVDAVHEGSNGCKTVKKPN